MTSPPDPRSPFDRMGGEPALRPIIASFVASMVKDPMIGFHFANVDVAVLTRREYELSAALLGAPVAYSGRPIRDVHAKHPIFGGQFMRRRQLLLEALQRAAAPADVISEMLAHVDRLRPLVTREQGSSCLGGSDVGPLFVDVPGHDAVAAVHPALEADPGGGVSGTDRDPDGIDRDPDGR